MHDDLLASKPEGARHDADICLFCVEQAQATTSRIPPGSAGPDVSEQTETPSTEGGTPNPMSDNADTMTKETHEALQTQAVAKAVESSDAALATATAKVAELETKVGTLEADNAGLKTDNERLNSELDTAQVSLNAATEEVASLKADIAKATEEAAKAKTATERASQVKNLKLYDDEYVAERASAWAELSDTAWAERLDEWSKLAKPAGGTATTTSSDTASAMSGTSEAITKTGETTDAASETTVAPRRAVLGLVAKGA